MFSRMLALNFLKPYFMWRNQVDELTLSRKGTRDSKYMQPPYIIYPSLCRGLLLYFWRAWPKVLIDPGLVADMYSCGWNTRARQPARPPGKVATAAMQQAPGKVATAAMQQAPESTRWWAELELNFEHWAERKLSWTELNWTKCA